MTVFGLIWNINVMHWRSWDDCIGGLLHLGPSGITFRTLLHLGQLLHISLQQTHTALLCSKLLQANNVLVLLSNRYRYGSLKSGWQHVSSLLFKSVILSFERKEIVHLFNVLPERNDCLQPIKKFNSYTWPCNYLFHHQQFFNRPGR